MVFLRRSPRVVSTPSARRTVVPSGYASRLDNRSSSVGILVSYAARPLALRLGPVAWRLNLASTLALHPRGTHTTAERQIGRLAWAVHPHLRGWRELLCLLHKLRLGLNQRLCNRVQAGGQLMVPGCD